MTTKDWLIILIMYATFWLYIAIDKYIIRKKFEKSLEENQNINITEGDTIITTAGIYGKVVKIKKDKVTIEIEDNMKMLVNISAILGKVD